MQQLHRTNISVVTPVSDAIERTKSILFSPFDISKWFTIGFCAFLAYLGKGGSPNLNFGNNFSGGNQNNSSQDIQNAISNNLPIVIAIAAVVVILVLALSILFYWLSCRGRFMFLHCVAKNVAQVKAPWSLYRREANSLLLFSISVTLVMVLIVLVFGAGIFLSTFLIRGGGMMAIGITLIVMIAMVLVGLIISCGLLMKFTNDFIVPIMYRNQCSCVQAWRYFWPMLSANKANFALYILFQIVIQMALQAIVVALFVATCCIACCLMAIPYIGAVLSLPITIFSRSYSLCYIRQYATQFNVLEEIEKLEE